MKIENLPTNFKRYEKKIYERCTWELDSWLQSDQRKALYDHFNVLRACYNMDYDQYNTFDIPVIHPIVKKQQIDREAVFNSAFMADDLISVKQSYGSNENQAKVMQRLINDSLNQQMFRQYAFRRIKRFTAAYGTSVVYTTWAEKMMEGNIPTETPDGLVFKPGKQLLGQYADNRPIHPLNYFQSPLAISARNTPYQGFVENITYGDFLSEYNGNEEFYIKDNMKKLMKDMNKTSIINGFYYKENEQSFDESTVYNPDGYSEPKEDEVNPDVMVRVIRMYSTVPIKGNEGNTEKYYIEIANGTIIKFWRNPHLYNIAPFSVFTCFERDDTWYGNTDAAFHVLHENIISTLLSVKASNVLKTMDPTTFVRKGVVDLADWMRRKRTGGFIEANIEKSESLSNAIYNYTPQDYSINSVQTLLDNIQQSDQLLRVNPNFNSGSLNQDTKYTTATGINAMNNQGDVGEANILDAFNVGMVQMAQNMIHIHQRYSPEYFQIDDQSGDVSSKTEIQGKYNLKVDTSMYTNKASEAIKFQNILSTIANLKGTQDPAYQNMNLDPFLRQYVKNNMDVGMNIDEILPAVPQMQQQVAPQAEQVMGGPQ